MGKGRKAAARYLSVETAAEVLGVAAKTVRSYYTRCGLDASRLPGGRVRIREDILHEWMASRRVVKSEIATGGNSEQ